MTMHSGTQLSIMSWLSPPCSELGISHRSTHTGCWARGNSTRRTPLAAVCTQPCSVNSVYRLNRRGSGASTSHGRARSAADSSSGAERWLESGQEPKDDSSIPEDLYDRKTLWMMAIKPPMYSVGYVPVLVSAAACYAVVGTVSLWRSAAFMGAATLVITWLNMSNDGFDADTGVDADKHWSYVKLLGGSRTMVLGLANVMLLLGCGLLLVLMSSTSDQRPAFMLATAIALGYLYQGPPFRLSYKGLGEPLCFAAFGPLATSAFYLAQLPPQQGAVVVSGLVWGLSVVIGLTTSLILFCSHFHQIDSDLAVGKMSPLVRLGTARAAQVLQAGVALTYGLLLAMAAAGLMPRTVPAAALLSLPWAANLLRLAHQHHADKRRIIPLKILATNWHMAVGFCLCLGLAVAHRFPAGLPLLA